MLEIYLVGCGVAIAITLTNWCVVSIASWITGNQIMGKNLRKLMPLKDIKNTRNFLLGCNVFMIFLSWLGVVISVLSISWTLLKKVLEVLRALFTPLPEAARIFKYRLKTDPEMTPEAVWANFFSLITLLAGVQPAEGEIEKSLSKITENSPDFNTVKALEILYNLGAVKSKV